MNSGKYFLQTFGCQMNEVDSGHLAGILEKAGWKLASRLEEAQLVILNSCSVRQASEDKIYGLGKVIKRLDPKPTVILTGCMVGSATGDRKRYPLSYLKKKLPWVDQFVKTEDLPILNPTLCHLGWMEGYGVPIMRGCNNFCSYCVVPYARGEETYYPQESILKNIQNLILKGKTKIILLGQNINSYPHFPQLLKDIHHLPGLKELGFITANPENFTAELVETLKLPKISRYLHLPVQSGNNEMLAKMNRPDTREKYLDLVKKIREAVPEIELGTDIIVGFPGETAAQFEDTYNLCKEIGFGQIYVSKYSPRLGTAAAKTYPDDVPLPEKRSRHQKILSLLLSPPTPNCN